MRRDVADHQVTAWLQEPHRLHAIGRVRGVGGDREAPGAAGGQPHLTGSGPTVFSLSDDAERARFVAERVARAGLAVTETRVRPEPASIETW